MTAKARRISEERIARLFSTPQNAAVPRHRRVENGEITLRSVDQPSRTHKDVLQTFSSIETLIVPGRLSDSDIARTLIELLLVGMPVRSSSWIRRLVSFTYVYLRLAINHHLEMACDRRFCLLLRP
jgi:hypothetical protein